MEKKPLLTFTVGKPFPGEVPHREGAIMELLEIGLVVVIQFPELTNYELSAFHKGFKKYSYLESPTTVPIAVWIFDFPNPHGQIDATFNARVVKKDLIDDFLDTSKGGAKNTLQFFLLEAFFWSRDLSHRSDIKVHRMGKYSRRLWAISRWLQCQIWRNRASAFGDFYRPM